MKKILLSALIAMSIISCKENTEKQSEISTEQSEVKVEVIDTTSEITFKDYKTEYKKTTEKAKIDLLLNWLFYYRYKEKYSLMTEFKYWIYLLKSNPKLLTSTLAIKYCPIIRKRKQLFPILFR